MIPYKQRTFRLKTSKHFEFEEDWYSWLINVWILEQPDSDELMKLFIELEFNTLNFIQLVVKGSELQSDTKT